jgi:hypothetical protein
MKKFTRLSIVMALEVVALEIGAYTYAALLYKERSRVLLETAILCLFGVIIGTLVTRRSRAQAASLKTIAFGIVAFSIGIFFLTVMEYHERAYTVLGIGILCLLGGFAGVLVLRSMAAVLSGVTLLGFVVLGMGVYFLTALGYHGRAFMVLGTGILCLLGSFVGMFVTQYRGYTRVGN